MTYGPSEVSIDEQDLALGITTANGWENHTISSPPFLKNFWKVTWKHYILLVCQICWAWKIKPLDISRTIRSAGKRSSSKPVFEKSWTFDWYFGANLLEKIDSANAFRSCASKQNPNQQNWIQNANKTGKIEKFVTLLRRVDVINFVENWNATTASPATFANPAPSAKTAQTLGKEKAWNGGNNSTNNLRIRRHGRCSLPSQNGFTFLSSPSRKMWIIN